MSSKSSTSSDVMIEARGLSKFYGEFAATRDVTFSVPRGQVCAFLGPNGAGKSTTMKMLTGFLSPSRGEAFLAGYNVAENRIAASVIRYAIPPTMAGLIQALYSAEEKRMINSPQ